MKFNISKDDQIFYISSNSIGFVAENCLDKLNKLIDANMR